MTDHNKDQSLRSARKRKDQTTEVREKKDKSKIVVKVPRGGNPHAENALSRKTTRGHKRKERAHAVSKGHSRKEKHKSEHQASAAHVATMHLLSRRTNELIRLKYNNLGDFGGTDPVTDSWVLEVAGPYDAMQELRPLLKQYKFRWNPQSKSWEIRATQYAYSNRKRQNFWIAARRNQEAAYPLLANQVEEINERLEAEDADPTPTRKELMRQIQRSGRISDRLKEMGIRVEYEYPNRYSVEEAKVWLFDAPFDLNPILKKHGFRWGSGQMGKGWWIPMLEYSAVLRDLVAQIFRKMPLPAGPSGGTAVFSDMDPRQLSRFLDDVVDRDMEFNEGYDGEVTEAELKRGYMKVLPRMKPHEQEQAMQNWEGGGLPSVNPHRSRR